MVLGAFCACRECKLAARAESLRDCRCGAVISVGAVGILWYTDFRRRSVLGGMRNQGAVAFGINENKRGASDSVLGAADIRI